MPFCPNHKKCQVVSTAVGMGAAYEFGLALLALLKGKETAERVRVSSLIPDAIAIPD